MAFLRAAVRVVYYELRGPEGAPVVAFANSLGTNVHVWDAVADGFRAFRVLRYDMRGHGLTETIEPDDDATTIAGLADDLAALLDALAIARVRVVGLSIGGMIAQRFAAAYPERVEAAVLCATANKIGTADTWNERIAAVRAGGTAAVRDGVMARWFTPATHAERPDLVRGFATMLERTPAAAYARACAAIRDADLAADDRRIACPVLAIAGADDLVTPPSDSRTLRETIPGARDAVVAGAAHIVPAEQPEAFLRLALPFLEDPHAAARTYAGSEA